MLLDDGISVSMVQLLVFWYTHQEMCVKQNNVASGCLATVNSRPTRQGGVLPPYLLVATYVL